jgi:hypothetical protein
VTLGGQAFFGSEFDEYWFYPTTAYVRVEFFF